MTGFKIGRRIKLLDIEKLKRYLYAQKNTIEMNLSSSSEEERLISMGKYNVYSDILNKIQQTNTFDK